VTAGRFDRGRSDRRSAIAAGADARRGDARRRRIPLLRARAADRLGELEQIAPRRLADMAVVANELDLVAREALRLTHGIALEIVEEERHGPAQHLCRLEQPARAQPVGAGLV